MSREISRCTLDVSTTNIYGSVIYGLHLYRLIHASINVLVKFPRSLREEGARFVVDSLWDAGKLGLVI